MTTQPEAQPTPLNFAFPFRDARGKDIVDEHVLYDWLANEGSGSFAVSASGMWHGGIHVSADGAGKQLDLGHGAVSIAAGEIVAYRSNARPLASHIAAGDGKPAQTGYFSSAFTLVRHTLEYPANNRLVFFSLYVHLQSVAEYRQNGMTAPAYWARCYEVTAHANDKPKRDPHHGAASSEQVGLNIHAEPGGHAILGILPRGARVRIGEKSRNGQWGKIEAIESGAPMPPQVASYVREGADRGWVFLEKEHGHPLLAPDLSEAQCDRVVVPPVPIHVDAGELIGHLGHYWLPDDPAREHRMMHIEVFCGDDLPGFLSASRKAADHIDDFDKLPLLRIDRGVKLFAGASVDQQGANAPETAIVQIYSQGALDALPADSKGPVDNDPFHHGNGEPWWKITSANSRYNDISGWVRNRQMPPAGGVTRESPYAWKDFETVTGSDAGNPTVFASVDAWLDHVLCEDKPSTGDIGKLKPLACDFYRSLSPMRNESHAADELRALKDNKWLRFRASRLIPKHRSEWASRQEYQGFFEKVFARVAKEPYHDAEMERLNQLVWWDDVKTHVSGPFPSSPDVFHIHPIALVGNFVATCHGAAQSLSVAGLRFILSHEARVGVTNRLHWPKGASGVTLGAGYDMKARSSSSIASDMLAIGLQATVSNKISQAAGLSGEDASQFAADNYDLVNLSDDQQIQLLRNTVKRYEDTVRRSIHVTLKQNEFDALVSFAYNPAGRWGSVSNFVNTGKIDDAMEKIKEGNTSGGRELRGLTNRRADEVNLYQHGRYEFNGQPLPVNQ
jgi:hypothetical protein